MTCLREAPEHDTSAADLTAFLGGEPEPDVDRLATRAGRHGVIASGLVVLDALGTAFGGEAQMPREELLGTVLPSALLEHELLRE